MKSCAKIILKTTTSKVVQGEETYREPKVEYDRRKKESLGVDLAKEHSSYPCFSSGEARFCAFVRYGNELLHSFICGPNSTKLSYQSSLPVSLAGWKFPRLIYSVGFPLLLSS